MKKTPILVILVFVVVALVGIVYFVTRPAAEEKKFKVAAVLPEEITDMDWSQPMYESLMEIKEEHPDWDVTYVEAVFQLVDAARYMRTWAEEGYDLIIGHGSEFPEATAEVARDFPDSYFWVSGGAPVEDAPANFFILDMREEEDGYLLGAFAAMMSETNHIGFIGGMDVGSITLEKIGYEQGAKTINPDIRVDLTFVGDFSDALTSKELTIGMINAGADVIMPMAGMQVEGAFAACREKNTWIIYGGYDKSSLAPEVTLWGTTYNFKPAIYRVYNALGAGRFPTPDEILFNYANDCFILGETFNSDVPQEVRTEALQIVEDLKAHRIQIETPY